MEKKLQAISYKRQVLKVFKYFSFFGYYPTSEEIYTFLPKKIDKTKLIIELKRLKYTPPQYSMVKKISKRKLENWKFKIYIRLLSLAPQIKLIGLSGSISMMNAGENDDIDLFIITAKNRMFTGRLIALVLAQILGLRRSRGIGEAEVFFSLSRGAPKGRDSRVIKNNYDSTKISKNKVCLNLFFDERELKIPKFKQSVFVGHEVLQMKPIVNKDNIYKRFLTANKWVFKLFPNAKMNLEFRIQNLELKNTTMNSKLIHNSKFIILNFGDILESILKKYQLNLIRKHQTTEIITDSQLWFHPDDFEKKLKLK